MLSNRHPMGHMHPPHPIIQVILFGSNVSCGLFMEEIQLHVGPPSAHRATRRGGGGARAKTKLRCEPFGCYAETSANADGVRRHPLPSISLRPPPEGHA